MIDSTVIEEAQNGGQSHSSFQREYCAQFTDGSDSYFSAKKMFECTTPDGETPTTEIKGDPDAKYILAIDPSFSDSPSSDYFAMSLMKLNEETKESTLVHGYAVAGGHLKDHIKYFYYLNKFFNFELIMIDNAGYQFIDSANESKFFKRDRIKLEFSTKCQTKKNFGKAKHPTKFQKQLQQRFCLQPDWVGLLQQGRIRPGDRIRREILGDLFGCGWPG